MPLYLAICTPFTTLSDNTTLSPPHSWVIRLPISRCWTFQGRDEHPQSSIDPGSLGPDFQLATAPLSLLPLSGRPCDGRNIASSRILLLTRLSIKLLKFCHITDGIGQ